MRWSAQPNQEEKEVGFPVYISNISAGFRFNLRPVLFLYQYIIAFPYFRNPFVSIGGT